MKNFSYLFFFIFPLLFLAACEDNAGEEDNSEFTDNWQERNATYFSERMAEAKAAVSEAKNAYGDDWESHCGWRIYRSYAKVTGGQVTDSICAKVVENGAGSGYPLYGDSVKVNIMGRLIPTASYSEGLVFAYSGLYESEESVFSPNFSTPAAYAVSNTVEGFGTALMHMRIGDRWKVYIPQELGYLSASTSVIPAYSTLIYDMQLKAFYRTGENATSD